MLNVIIITLITLDFCNTDQDLALLPRTMMNVNPLVGLPKIMVSSY